MHDQAFAQRQPLTCLHSRKIINRHLADTHGWTASSSAVSVIRRSDELWDGRKSDGVMELWREGAGTIYLSNDVLGGHISTKSCPRSGNGGPTKTAKYILIQDFIVASLSLFHCAAFRSATPQRIHPSLFSPPESWLLVAVETVFRRNPPVVRDPRSLDLEQEN